MDLPIARSLDSKFSKSWSDDELKTIWECLFDPTLCKKAQYDDKNLQGVIMLLETISESIKQMGFRCASLLVSYKSSVQELEEKKQECTMIKSELKSLKAPCGHCSALKNELKEANQRAEDAEMRMSSIAKILRIGNASDPKDGASVRGIAENDLTLVSQMLLINESPNRQKKQGRFEEGSENKIEKVIATPVDVINESLAAVELETGISIAVSPWQLRGKQLVKEVPARVVGKYQSIDTSQISFENVQGHVSAKKRETKRLKKNHMSSSVNIPLQLKTETRLAATRKNLTADFTSHNTKTNFFELEKGNFKFSPQKKCSSADDKVEKNYECEENVKGINLDDCKGDVCGSILLPSCSKDNSELEKIWFSSEEKVAEDDKVSKLWKLRQNRCPDKTVKGGKKMKQTTLAVATKTTRKQDLSLKKEFSFIGESDNPLSENNGENEEDDIVLPSPKQKKVKKRERRSPNIENTKLDSIDLLTFAPVATSTQVPKSAVFDTSYDRIPVKSKSSPSPKYNYKHPSVKEKRARAKLQGEDCDDCAKYYKAFGQDSSPTKLKERINSCSRHRNQNFLQHTRVRPKTPPGFWDPVVPNTEECRDKGFYTSVYRSKDFNS